MSAARALAPAKINPWLAVLGRRPDGYRELDTVMVALDLCDVVSARAVPGGGLSLELTGPQASADVPADARNLAWRAAAAARDALVAAGRVDPGLGLALSLEKRVPSQAGLGGGSADAAGALLAVEAALGARLADAERGALLAGLGSDTSFFLCPTGLARCTGRGERVAPLAGPPPDWWVALLVPAVACPTAAVYSALEGPPEDPPRAPDLGAGGLLGAALQARPLLFNRLEEAALRAIPELRAWRDALTAGGAGHFRLSGSGSSFFGLYADERAARGDLARLATALAERGLVPRLCTVCRPRGRGAALAPG